MRLVWTPDALGDLNRLYEFIAPRNRAAAARAVQALRAAPEHILQHPRIGERMRRFDPREVRRVLVRGYEIRSEIRDSRVYVLRLFHTRENR